MRTHEDEARFIERKYGVELSKDERICLARIAAKTQRKARKGVF